MTHDIAAIAIGRNEGERLVRCFASLQGRVGLIVYVDSGSTDGSVAAAQDSGAEVVALDLSVPFTAARARNAGLARVLELAPGGTIRSVPRW
jgi:glycosyltransferase involved in cell wall biosynthesis